MKSIFLLLILGGAAFGIHFYINSEEGDRSFPGAQTITDIFGLSEKKNRSFPVTRTITDNSGRSMKVEVIGMRDGWIKFTRVSDGKAFEFSISRLSEKDQKYFRTMPEGGLLPAETVTAKDHRIENLKAKVRELEAESLILEMKAEDPSGRYENKSVEHYQKLFDENESTLNHLRVKILELEGQ